MDRHNPPQPPPEWLAAYIDGELSPDQVTQVEEWFAAHPKAAEDLADQALFAPQNGEFWDSVSPPMPSDDRWRQQLEEIRLGLAVEAARKYTSTPKKPWRFRPILLFGLLVVVPVFGILRWMGTAYSPTPNNTFDGVIFVPNQEQAWPVANADDVVILRLSEEAAGSLVVGRHPLGGEPLQLARAVEVEIHQYQPNEQGLDPDIQVVDGPSFPMIWFPARKP